MRVGVCALSGKLEHRRTEHDGQPERVPQRATVEAHPQNENEGGADQRHEEAIATLRRKAENAPAWRLRPEDRQQRQDSQSQRDQTEEDSRFARSKPSTRA